MNALELTSKFFVFTRNHPASPPSRRITRSWAWPCMDVAENIWTTFSDELVLRYTAKTDSSLDVTQRGLRIVQRFVITAVPRSEGTEMQENIYGDR